LSTWHTGKSHEGGLLTPQIKFGDKTRKNVINRHPADGIRSKTFVLVRNLKPTFGHWQMGVVPDAKTHKFALRMYRKMEQSHGTFAAILDSSGDLELYA
jgi:hypothetical protein